MHPEETHANRNTDADDLVFTFDIIEDDRKTSTSMTHQTFSEEFSEHAKIPDLITDLIKKAHEMLLETPSEEMEDNLNLLEKHIREKGKAPFPETLADFTNDIQSKVLEINQYALEAAYLYSIWVDENLPEYIWHANNIAYMSRRGEKNMQDEISPIEAAILLKEGIKARNPFSLINMALLYCLPSDITDWEFAVKLIREIDPDRMGDALDWWQRLYDQGDIEAYLVFYLFRTQGLLDLSGDEGNFLAEQEKLIEAGYNIPLKDSPCLKNIKTFAYMDDL